MGCTPGQKLTFDETALLASLPWGPLTPQQTMCMQAEDGYALCSAGLTQGPRASFRGLGFGALGRGAGFPSRTFCSAARSREGAQKGVTNPMSPCATQALI